jgi:hypothetical protein
MSLISRAAFLAVAALSCATAVSADGRRTGRAADEPPLEIKFKQSCDLPEGRQQVYDPETGVFHIHFKARRSSYEQRAAFEVAKVGVKFTKPVVFRLTGVPSAYGCLGHPLILSVGDKSYAIDASCADHYWGQEKRFDKTLFRSERKDRVVTIEFTEKGQALLKPGAQIAFKIDTGW